MNVPFFTYCIVWYNNIMIIFPEERLKRNFFRRHPKDAAPNLLGKYLAVKVNGKTVISKIVEVESYGGKEDKGCHVGRFGLTKRTAPLFEDIGFSYIYSVHINTYCLNIVTHKDAGAGGILIRALEPKTGVKELLKNLNKNNGYDIKKLLNGPGKLCKALKIDKRLNRKDIIKGNRIFILKGERIKKSGIAATSRINIPYAKISKEWHWRFIIKDSPFLSRR